MVVASIQLLPAFSTKMALKANPTDIVVGVVTYATLAIGFSGGWYLTRPMKYSGWLLAVGIIAGIEIVELLGN